MAARFITVSVDILQDKELNQSQKFILAEIEQLTQLELGCIATNDHFAKLIGISKENVSKNLNSLKSKGYIDVEIIKGSRNHQRHITLIKLITPPYQSSNPPLSNRQETKGNIQSNKTINNIPPDFFKIFPKELIEDGEFMEAWEGFEMVRRKRKTATTERAYKTLLTDLMQYSKGDIAKSIEIVDKSAISGYPNLYAIKENK